ncbi:hypothetical protein SLS56_002369 [Neofusicoccum ribis]|uniref:S-formylglutathione hydrolase n=1 Tax=Neofusicoccum ribis TaxID=45134 RepID=A0ABR3T450_9PEZI
MFTTMAFSTTEIIPCFGGKMLKLTHDSKSTACKMALNLYLPPQAISGAQKVPVLMYLSGLTCTSDNCSEKGFFQHRASGLGVPGEDDAIDLGTGASYYVDATRDPWSKGYNMYTYLTKELPEALFGYFQELDGTRFLKNPGKYKSCSAFAPVANPIQCPWGQKAFTEYFGADSLDKWKESDATELVKKWKGPLNLLIDIGTADHFEKEGQLLVDNFIAAAKEVGVDQGIRYRRQPGYNHSYYFMSTFADEHVDYAADALFVCQKSLI